MNVLKKRKYVISCPVCGASMNDRSHYEECFGLICCESSNECPQCGFGDEFAYGGYRLGFFLDDFESNLNLNWSYQKPPTQIEFKRLRKKIFTYRRRLLKTGKIKTLGNMKF